MASKRKKKDGEQTETYTSVKGSDEANVKKHFGSREQQKKVIN